MADQHDLVLDGDGNLVLVAGIDLAAGPDVHVVTEFAEPAPDHRERTYDPIGVFEEITANAVDNRILTPKPRHCPPLCLTIEQAEALREVLDQHLAGANGSADALTRALISSSVEVGKNGQARPSGRPRRGAPRPYRPRVADNCAGVHAFIGRPLTRALMDGITEELDRIRPVVARTHALHEEFAQSVAEAYGENLEGSVLSYERRWAEALWRLTLEWHGERVCIDISDEEAAADFRNVSPARSAILRLILRALRNMAEGPICSADWRLQATIVPCVGVTRE